MKHVRKAFASCLAAALLAACGTQNDQPVNIQNQDESNASLDTSSVQSDDVRIQVLLQEENSRTSRYLGSYNDIDNVSIDLKNQTSGSLLQTIDLSFVSGAWTGTLSNVNIGQLYQFDGKAYDNQSVMIFSGTTIQALDNGTTTLNLRLDPVADSTILAIPRITRIMVPSSVGTGDNTTVQVEIEGSSGAQLDYTFEAPQGGSFSPAAGTVNLLGTSATLSSTYMAPISTGPRTNTIEVTNAQGIGVKSSFTVSVAVPSTANTIGIQFSPVITSLVGWRDNATDRITWITEVADDGPQEELRYSWSFQMDSATPSPSTYPDFMNRGTNPGIMTGYSPDLTGTLSLTVTDDNGTGGSTTVEYAVQQGQFPDGLVSEIAGSSLIWNTGNWNEASWQ